ncbi:MAG: OmpA family protein [Prevotella sp.]|nr:OmpA family protein [Prevotella sp.]
MMKSPFCKQAIVLAILLALFSCGTDRNLKRGEKFLALGEYYDASSEYKTAYSKTPAKERAKRGQIAKKMAFCYDKINSTQKAIAAYRNVIRYKQDDGETHLSFARQLMKNGNYKEAAEEFRVALDSMPDNILAKNGLESAMSAPKLKEDGSRYSVKRMEVFNSRRADYSPMLMGEDHDQLYFTSTRNEAEGDELSGITGTKNGDIFFSQKDDKGKWGKPQRVESGLNSQYDEGACCFSSDEREMYLTQCSSDPSYPRYAKIMKSNRSDAAWGKPSDVELTRDTLSSYAHPAVSPDGEWLYFCSDMPGGEGGLDIWRVRLTTSGLGGVENLGPSINTAGDEMFPTFRPNGDLYYSSNGLPGMGGLDIYIATVNDFGQYELEHPGYPLNSQGDDFGLTVDGPHNRGFFCSNLGDGRGWDHIFSFEKPEIIQTVKGWVYEMDGYELTAAQVYMVGNDGTNEKLSVRSDGSFEQVLTPGVDYVFLATCRGYLNHKEELHVVATDDSYEHVLQFPLASITVPVMIDNIFYDYDKATLRPESTQALDELVTLLNENPNVTIELSAHCDYHGSQAYNIGLAQRRAESVVDYLIAHGIVSDRLTPKGYGKEKPKVVRKKLAAQYDWLKEGDVLTEEFIKALDKDKQDICDQLNRRTEFIVLRTTYGMFDKDGNLTNPPKQKPKEEEESEDDGFFIDF